MDNRREWSIYRDELVSAIVSLGFPGEFGDQIAKQLGSPKAIQRMYKYLNNVKPKSAKLIADEMLSICTEIERWKEKNPDYLYSIFGCKFGIPGCSKKIALLEEPEKY